MSSFNSKKHTKKKQSPFRFVLGVLAIAAALLLVWFIAQKVITKTIQQVAPVPASAADMLLSKKALVQKVADLQATLAADDAELVTAKLLATENDALKTELGRFPAPTGVLSHVITLPNRSFYDTMNIDAGTDDGVSVGQVAYGFGSIALGTISAVAPDHATVTLFSAPGTTTSGTAQGSDVAVTLIGRGGGEYEVRIPRDVQFAVGDLVAYQSTDTAVLAQIERITTDPRDPFQRLIAKAPVNLQALKWVIVR